MKKLFLASVIALFSMGVMAQTGGIKFFEGSFSELKKAAVQAKKPIFIDIYTTWCGPCKYLSAEIFPKEVTGKYMNANFVNAKFDAEKGEGIDLAKEYSIKAYPTMLILDANGKELGRIVGGERTPELFIEKVKKAFAEAQK